VKNIKEYLFNIRLEHALTVLTCLSLLHACYIGFYYSNQELLDWHSFRQTQTALTSLWFIKGGIKLAYETPVGGFPWSIPFEFPLYQYIVAVISELLEIPLSQTGRITSFLFYLFTLYPAHKIFKELKQDHVSFFIFAIFYLTSPLYLYWGRSFMIETTALFFSILSISYFLRFLNNPNILNSALFSFFASIAILQKATTPAPMMVGLGIIWLFSIKRDHPKDNTIKYLLISSWMFLIPLITAIIWTKYTDHIKEYNQFGSLLTSKALSKWNWGTWEQRIDINLLTDIFWRRISKNNLAGLIGCFLISAPLFSGNIKLKKIILVSLGFAILPVFLFINLHRAHDYYQTSCLIFFIFALAISTNYWRYKKIVLVLVLLVIFFNLRTFIQIYNPIIKENYSADNNRDINVSAFLKKNLSENESFVAFGNDWSSTFAYLSHRKSFTVPKFYPDAIKVFETPSKFTGPLKAKAIVSCPSDFNTISPIYSELSEKKIAEGWKETRVVDCWVLTRN